MKHSWVLVVLASACGQVVTSDPPDVVPPPPPGGDGRCDPSAAFGAPIGRDFATSSTGGATGSFTMVGDELEAVIASGPDLALATRATRDDDFNSVVPLFASTERVDDLASFTADGLRLYLRSDGFLAVATRGDRSSPFDGGGPITVGGVPQLAGELAISADGENLYYVDSEDSAQLLRVAQRVDDLTFAAGLPISTGAVARPVLSADQLVLFRADGGEILASRRASLDEPFGPGAPLVELNTDAFEAPLAVSLDDCVLYFQSERAGHAGLSDVWKAQRPR